MKWYYSERREGREGKKEGERKRREEEGRKGQAEKRRKRKREEGKEERKEREKKHRYIHKFFLSEIFKFSKQSPPLSTLLRWCQ